MANKPRWTPQQQLAIEARGGTLLVSAAAGSGKTAVLTERALRRMLDDPQTIDADRLLIVTFTTAAAQEMKQRLIDKLAQRIEEQPGNEHARRQRRLLDRASIGTIHSFCFELLRQNFQKLGLPAVFRIGDEQETEAMRGAAVSAALEEGYRDENDAQFFALVELLSSRRGDDALASAVLRVLDFARAHPFYLDWLDERMELFCRAQKPEESVWGDIIFERARQLAADAQRECAAALAQIDGCDGLEPYRGALQSDSVLLEGLAQRIAARGWDSVYHALRELSHQRLGAAKKAPEELREQVKTHRERIKETTARLRDKLFDASAEEFAQDVAEQTAQIGRLFALTRRTDELLLEQKQSTGIIDFSDLEQMTLSLLVQKENGQIVPTPLAKECAGRFDEIMVDEYQDVNGAQDLILTALSNGENLFLVGDVKQSIYRFRQARPELFLGRAASYPDCDGSSFPAKISLNGSFRSRANLSGSINQVFAALMRREAAELDYDESQALVPLALYPPCEESGMELALIDPGSLSDEDTAAAAEARYVAARVAEMLKQRVPVNENGTLRSVQPGDIAILLRSPRNRAEQYRAALREVGVEGDIDAPGGFLDAPEIMSVCNLLHVIDNPTLDIPLAGAMLSPLLGFSDDDLVRIRVDCRQGSLWQAVCAAAQQGDLRCQELLTLVETLRRKALSVGAPQLILELLARTGFALYCRAMPNGVQRHRNLMLLVSYADSYHQKGYWGLSAFLRILDRIAERGEDLASAPPAQGTDKVTITSIHRSKGLEWPVVILADAAHTHSFYRNDLIAPTLLHSELGFASVRRDAATRRQYPTVPLTAVRLESERALLAEELRVLYVAMTRAKERLLITASVREPRRQLREQPGGDGQPLAAARILEGRSFSVWLMMALAQREDYGLLLSGGRGEDGMRISLVEAPFGAEAVETPEEAPKEAVQPDAKLLSELARRVEFVYPFAQSSLTPAKLSVSQLTHPARLRLTARPQFLNGDTLTGAARGSAVHAYMQFCDYRRAKEDPAGELSRLVSGGWLTARQAEAVSLSVIKTFFESPLAGRIFAADRVLREFRFMAPASVSPLAGAAISGNGESAMLQGIADCILIEGEHAVLIDYKTDRVSSGAALTERYAPQLLLYRDMLRGALGMQVSQCLIWSFALGCQIEVSPDEKSC